MLDKATSLSENLGDEGKQGSGNHVDLTIPSFSLKKTHRKKPKEGVPVRRSTRFKTNFLKLNGER